MVDTGKIATVTDDGAPKDGEPVRSWGVECWSGLHHWARPANEAAHAIIEKLQAEGVPFRFFCHGDLEENPSILDWEPGVAGPVTVRTADVDGYPTLSELGLRGLMNEQGPLTDANAAHLACKIISCLRTPADPMALTYRRDSQNR